MSASDIQRGSLAGMMGRVFRRSCGLALGSVAAAVALLAGTQAAVAQSYPSKPLRVIVPYAAGGTTDALARTVGNKLTEALGQSVVIENRAGANGAIGSDIVAKARPDGYTLLMVTSSHVINPSVMASLPFDPLKDFTPVTFVASSPVLIVSPPESPFGSMPEMIAHVKANPGKLSIGNSDASSMLIVELLKQAAGLDLQQVAYKGGGALLTDIVGGHIPLGAMGSGTAYSAYKAKRLRVLGVTPATRTPSMPEVPTIAESGVSGFDYFIWYGLLAPPGLPSPIADRLHQEIVKILADPATKDHLTDLGAETSGTSPAETAAIMKTDLERWAKAAKAANVKPE